MGWRIGAIGWPTAPPEPCGTAAGDWTDNWVTSGFIEATLTLPFCNITESGGKVLIPAGSTIEGSVCRFRLLVGSVVGTGNPGWITPVLTDATTGDLVVAGLGVDLGVSGLIPGVTVFELYGSFEGAGPFPVDVHLRLKVDASGPIAVEAPGSDPGWMVDVCC